MGIGYYLLVNCCDIWGKTEILDTFVLSDLTRFQLDDFAISDHGKRTIFLLVVLQTSFYNPFLVHVESYRGYPVVRIGSYGLKGSGGLTSSILSSAQVAAGVALVATGAGSVAGATLIGSGLGGLGYAVAECDSNQPFNWEDYAKRTLTGVASGITLGIVTVEWVVLVSYRCNGRCDRRSIR